ncbi:MAG: SDR family oxidoreductase [Caldilineaceae bacterium]
MNFDFTHKVALVTGGGSGIGEACARTFAAGGARVVVADLDNKGGQRVTDTLTQKGSEASFIHVNVADPPSVEQMVQHAINHYGQLDIAVNNAGIGGEAKPTGEYSVESWRQVIDVNLNGVFYCMRYEIPQMLEHGGAIVNMASILGTVGFATAVAYVSAKHGVVGMTQNAALEYSGQGIRINAVGPGFIKTPLLDANLNADTLNMLAKLHPIGRLGEAQEVANLVAFLCSDEASFISGSYHLIDGGYTAQ